jgi:hypothetical protein
VDRRDHLPGELWLPKPFPMDELATAVNIAFSRLVEFHFGWHDDSTVSAG